MKRFLGTLALLAAFPAACQNLTAVLRVDGNVMVGSADGFVSARDGQPILVGQRFMVGDNATATVVYSRNCERKYSDTGVHTVEPGNCKDQDHDRSDDQSTEQSAAGASGATTLQSLAIILGTVGLAAGEISQMDETSVPVSQ